jgi:hypothetical protein
MAKPNDNYKGMGTRYKNEYGEQPPELQSHVVEGPHGFIGIPPLDELPANHAGFLPVPVKNKPGRV